MDYHGGVVPGTEVQQPIELFRIGCMDFCAHVRLEKALPGKLAIAPLEISSV